MKNVIFNQIIFDNKKELKKGWFKSIISVSTLFSF